MMSYSAKWDGPITYVALQYLERVIFESIVRKIMFTRPDVIYKFD